MARRYADLDLAPESHRAPGLGRIAEALSESKRPFKVDIVDLLTIDPVFKGSPNDLFKTAR
jgi:hypothetical protein